MTDMVKKKTIFFELLLNLHSCHHGHFVHEFIATHYENVYVEIITVSTLRM